MTLALISSRTGIPDGGHGPGAGRRPSGGRGRPWPRPTTSSASPLSRLMAEGPEDELTATKNAQPAILTHSVAVLRVLREPARSGRRWRRGTPWVSSARTWPPGPSPSRRAGGGAAPGRAHVPGGPGATGHHGRRAGPRRRDPGGGVRPGGRGICVPANFNSAGQIVISGDVAGVEQGMALASEAGAKRVLPAQRLGRVPLAPHGARGPRPAGEARSHRLPGSGLPGGVQRHGRRRDVRAPRPGTSWWSSSPPRCAGPPRWRPWWRPAWTASSSWGRAACCAG